MGAKCTATTTNGEPCGGYALQGKQFCFTHDPARAADRAAARTRGGQNRRTAHGGTYSGPATIRTLADVLTVLDYALSESLELENSIQRGRLLVSIAGEYTKAIQTADLEARLLALETILKSRGDK